MRTTIDLPDALFRKAKATAALQGFSLKDLIATAVDEKINALHAKIPARQVKLPLIPWKGKKKLDLSNFDFDDLLG